MPSSWASSMRAWAYSLTRLFSQTGASGEKEFPEHLRASLAQHPYFLLHPEHLRIERTIGDPFERYIFLALVRGSGTRTVILTGHYDVVGIENYGELADVACDPEALLPRLIARLQEESAQSGDLPPADRLALDDLLSGEFMPGRGLLDMKTGLAAGLSVLARFAEIPPETRYGNLLFIAVPDEELASNGARSAVRLLPGLALEWGLSIEAAINLDASDDPGDGTFGQAIYLGSVGKLLPSAFIAGRETHAGSPFSGVNAALLAAQLTRRMECNLDLADTLDGEWSVPPTCLKQTDSKTHYDVTTPVTTWCYYNWLSLQRPASQSLSLFRALALDALVSTLADLRASAQEYSRRSGQPVASPDWPALVFTYAEVKALAARVPGHASRLDALERELAANPALDTPEVCRHLTEAAWELSGLVGPAVVVGFAALYYPPVALNVATSSRAARLRAVLVEQAAAVSDAFRTPIALRPYFPGISDVSFLSSQVSAGDITLLASNTPAWHSRAAFDHAAAAALDLPVVNIGPWGRDYHQRLERVHVPYSFEVLPELLWRVAEALLDERNDG